MGPGRRPGLAPPNAGQGSCLGRPLIGIRTAKLAVYRLKVATKAPPRFRSDANIWHLYDRWQGNISMGESMSAGSLTRWVAFADKQLRLGYEVAGSAGPAILRNNDVGIRLKAVSLIARSLSNMRGMLAMVREKRIVEARVLARCILENEFWAAGFADDPDKFEKAMSDHDLNKRGSSGQMLLAAGQIPDEIERNIRKWLRDNKGWNKAKSVGPKQVAKDAQPGDAYVFYNRLSEDAHPISIQSRARKN